MNTTATKKIALATLAAPVLAALAIGLAGSAAAAPARPQPSDTGATTTRGQEKGNCVAVGPIGPGVVPPPAGVAVGPIGPGVVHNDLPGCGRRAQHRPGNA